MNVKQVAVSMYKSIRRLGGRDTFLGYNKRHHSFKQSGTETETYTEMTPSVHWECRSKHVRIFRPVKSRVLFKAGLLLTGVPWRPVTGLLWQVFHGAQLLVCHVRCSMAPSRWFVGTGDPWCSVAGLWQVFHGAQSLVCWDRCSVVPSHWFVVTGVPWCPVAGLWQVFHGAQSLVCCDVFHGAQSLVWCDRCFMVPGRLKVFFCARCSMAPSRTLNGCSVTLVSTWWTCLTQGRQHECWTWHATPWPTCCRCTVRWRPTSSSSCLTGG